MNAHALLDSNTHRALRVRTDASADLGDAVMTALAMPTEFRQVQAHYPIVFRRDLTTGSFSALALFGFETGENLFLADGRWDAAFRPLAHRVTPFLIGAAAAADGAAQVHIDLAHPRVTMAADGSGIALFDVDGRPTPLLESIAQDLGDLDGAYKNSMGFFAALERHDLLEPFTLEVPLADGSKHSLVGFHIIAEDRLRSLDASDLGALHADDHLMPIFMAMASISQFSALVSRRNARLAHG
ncbi:SapC family protein [Sandarakinorhabdus sp.]|uniref:SapC family protein n=1 Tax=Sandarakinorhabdus sp. TaxID=1916663 RepID=UPI00333E7322